MVFEHLLQRVDNRCDLVAGQAGDAELSVMLNHIQVQRIAESGRAKETHIRDLFGIGCFVHGTDIVDIERVVASAQNPAGFLSSS